MPDLTRFGLQPIGVGGSSTPGGAGTKTITVGSTTPGDDLPPAPHEAPEFWNRIVLGNTVDPKSPYLFPAIDGEGCVTFAPVKKSADLDKQKPNGRKYPKVKVKGLKPIPVKITFTFTRKIWAQSIALMQALDPDAPKGDQPREVLHPVSMIRRFSKLLVEEVEEQAPKGDSYSFTVEGMAWTEPAAATVGGTTTPKKAAVAPPGTVPIGSNNNFVGGMGVQIGSNGNLVGGFEPEGGSAPSAA